MINKLIRLKIYLNILSNLQHIITKLQAKLSLTGKKLKNHNSFISIPKILMN